MYLSFLQYFEINLNKTHNKANHPIYKQIPTGILKHFNEIPSINSSTIVKILPHEAYFRLPTMHKRRPPKLIKVLFKCRKDILYWLELATEYPILMYLIPVIDHHFIFHCRSLIPLRMSARVGFPLE